MQPPPKAAPGARWRRWREQQRPRLPQEALSLRLGLSAGRVSKIERDAARPGAKAAAAMARLTGIAMEFWLGWIDEPRRGAPPEP